MSSDWRSISASDALFRALAEFAPVGIYVVRGERAIYANRRFAAMFGRSSDEIVALGSIAELVAPEHREQALASIRRRNQTGAAESFVATGVRPDGTRFVLEVHSGAVDLGGERLLVGMAVDATERVRTAEELLAERRTLAATLEALPVGVWMLNRAGAVERTNAAARALDERKLRAPADIETWPMRRSLVKGERVVGEHLEVTAADGAHVDLLASSAPIVDGEGAIIGAVGTLLDVTEPRRVQRSLDFERRRLATIFAQVPAFIAVVRGPEHVFELANDAYYALVGRRDVVGKRVDEAVPELRDQGFVRLLDEIFATGEPRAGRETPLAVARGPNGEMETRFVDYAGHAIAEEDGSRSGVLVMGIDVTERVRADGALRASERRARAQFKGMPVPTYAWQLVDVEDGKDFVLIDYNDAAERITRGAIASYVGQRLTQMYRDRADILRGVRAALEGTTLREEIDYPFSWGETKRLSVTYTGVPPDIVLVHTEDITERVALEDQLRQSQKMEAIGQLAGGVAHDFNNLLTIISTCASFLGESLPPEDELQRDVADIRDAAGRAATLTKQLLAFSRRQLLVPTTLDLNAVVHAVEPMLRRLIGADIRIVIDPSPELGLVKADRVQIEQVVLNLAVNARDAMPNGGTLTIATRDVTWDALSAARHGVHAGRYATITVKDTGLGMAPETLERVFEPFFTTKEQGRGTGLGLSTAYGIAKQSGGTMTVESRAGEGATFLLALPHDAATEGAETSRNAGTRSERGTERILLVEDERSVRTITRRLLERQGYAVVEASQGREALEVVREASEPFDLLLTDVVMPELGGRELHALLVAEQPGLPVLYISGYTDDAIFRRDMADEGSAFLQKPFTADELARAVRTALAKSRRR